MVVREPCPVSRRGDGVERLMLALTAMLFLVQAALTVVALARRLF